MATFIMAFGEKVAWMSMGATGEATGSIYVGHCQKGRRHGRGTVLFGPRHKE